MKKSSSLLFFGSGPVALKSLEYLSTLYDIEGVITKPKAVKQKDTPLVINWAITHKVPYHTVASKAELDTLFTNLTPASRVGIVVDFGIIISNMVIESFDLGIINSHFSLLPKLRGADPISFAILEGLTETGVSLMKIVPALDEGPLLAQRAITISPSITEPELTNTLIELSCELFKEYLPKYISGELNTYEQDVSKGATYTRKLTKQDGIIDWQDTAQDIERQVRTFLQWPKSRTHLGEYDVIITKVSLSPVRLKPGTVQVVQGELLIGTATEAIKIDELKPAGKGAMSAKSFLAGYSIPTKVS